MTNGNGTGPGHRGDRGIADQEGASDAFARLSQELMPDHDEQATLDRICAYALRLIPAADLCGITVRRRRGRLETLAQSDPLAQRCDELQYELGEGPCIDSALEAEPFLVTSTAHDERWPRWGPRAAQEGVHSLISVQLVGPQWHPRKNSLGAINLYGRHVDAFGPDDLGRARVFAVHAANALATVRMVGGLDAAVGARHRIGVAQGILMQRYDLDVDAAFELMERLAGRLDVKVRDVAAHVVEHGNLPDPDGTPKTGQ